ncbi:TetR/AcrR family transcriptional regulator [Pseudomonas sp. MWU12-2037]|uniref:TetR/AcrR family transcriptional regulator n=1 Tax=Pseudomonas sp. MWU12-2037 TaxID=2928690 RepID=UPI002010143C|nr:TetR/AcrR family transcriptional regulator [Pseudomonas sp. MWU12-2037]
MPLPSLHDEAAKSLGRPRDDSAGPALLEAARKLVSTHGYGAVSVQKIAEEAGVGRQTLYRRWPSKAELVLDAFMESAERIEVPAQGGAEAVMRGFLTNLFSNLGDDGAALRSLMASAQQDPQFRETFRERFLAPRATIVRLILENARQLGEISADADIETAVVALHGAFWYRMLLGEPLDKDFAISLSALIFRSVV